MDIWQSNVLPPSIFSGVYYSYVSKVVLRWVHESIAPVIELAYDTGQPIAGNIADNRILAVRFSPDEPCRLINIKYFLMTRNSTRFNALVYEWDDDNVVQHPGDLIESIPSIEVNHLSGWYTVPFLERGLSFEGDFVIGYSSEENNIRLGIDAEYSNMSWTFQDDEWEMSEYIHFIRAEVQYSSGEIEEIEAEPGGLNELDAIREFNVYRNGMRIATVDTQGYTEVLDEYGFFTYEVSAAFDEGESEKVTIIEFGRIATEVEPGRDHEIPTVWSIDSIYPNPFNSTLNISVGVPCSGRLKIEVFDLNGRSVALIEDGFISPGYFKYTWNSNLTSGIYFLRAKSSTGWSSTKKLILLK
jgi:hypothetical protein